MRSINEISFVRFRLYLARYSFQKVNPDVLFKLFGCYGDVTSVKIMYNRKNTALVQFVTEEQAQRALKYLNGINLYGKPLHVNFSKHDKINHRAPEPGSAEDVAGEGLHRDFLDHKLHRFRSSKSRNHVNIYEPSKVLHIAGLVEEATDEDVEALFQDLNFNIKKLRMFTSNNKKMALIELNNVETAVQALIALHGYDLGGLSLRVSFSKGQLN